MTRERPAPRVSVISIFLDAEPFLGEAVESVLAQDYRDFELLLVDDGSSDRSTAIARDYAAREPDRISYLEHPGHANRGMSASRNLGIAAATGEFIAFIDSDDRWRPHKLREQVAILESLPEADAVCGSVNYWQSWNGGEDRLEPTGHVRNRLVPPPEASLALYPLGTASAPSMSDLLFRRPCFSALGGFEEGFTGAYEDQAFLAKFYLYLTLYVTEEVWSDYRLHDRSCMAVTMRSGRYEESRRRFLEWFDNYLAASGRKFDLERRVAVKRLLLPAHHPRLHKSLRTVKAATRSLFSR